MPASDQGQPTRRYTVVPRTLIFITRPGEVLLLKGAAHKGLWAGRYNGFGGHVERGENAALSARRELAEESGLQTPLRLCGVVSVDVEPTWGVLLFVFHGEWQGDQPQAGSEGDPEWLPLAALDELPVVEDLPVLLARVLNHLPTAAPFFAHSRYDEQGKLQVEFQEDVWPI